MHPPEMPSGYSRGDEGALKCLLVHGNMVIHTQGVEGAVPYATGHSVGAGL